MPDCVRPPPAFIPSDKTYTRPLKRLKTRRECPPCIDFPESPESPVKLAIDGAFMKERMTFDGVASTVEAPQPACNLGGHEGLTISAWVKRIKEDVAWDRLIDFGNGAEMENVVISFQGQTMYEVRNGDGVQHLAVGAGLDPAGTPSPGAAASHSRLSPFPPGRWMHVALVHDPDGIASIYWNGALKARGPVWLPPSVHREKYYIGKSHWTHDPYFKGEISDVHVFNYALNPAEVGKAYFSRSLPARGKPILSLASGWRLSTPQKALSDPLEWAMRRPVDHGRHACGCEGCGGLGRCGGGGGANGAPLQFFTGLCTAYKLHALSQLQQAFERHKEQVLPPPLLLQPRTPTRTFHPHLPPYLAGSRVGPRASVFPRLQVVALRIPNRAHAHLSVACRPGAAYAAERAAIQCEHARCCPRGRCPEPGEGDRPRRAAPGAGSRAHDSLLDARVQPYPDGDACGSLHRPAHAAPTDRCRLRPDYRRLPRVRNLRAALGQ